MAGPVCTVEQINRVYLRVRVNEKLHMTYALRVITALFSHEELHNTVSVNKLLVWLVFMWFSGVSGAT